MNRFRSNLGCSFMVPEKLYSSNLHPNMGLVQIWTDFIQIFHTYRNLSGTVLKFWGTLLWGLGLNMDRFRSKFAHLFMVTEEVYKPNFRQIVYILCDVWWFKGNLFKFWVTLLCAPGLNMDRFCSNLSQAFIVSQKVYTRNLSYSMYVLWGFKWTFWTLATNVS